MTRMILRHVGIYVRTAAVFQVAFARRRHTWSACHRPCCPRFKEEARRGSTRARQPCCAESFGWLASRPPLDICFLSASIYQSRT